MREIYSNGALKIYHTHDGITEFKLHFKVENIEKVLFITEEQFNIMKANQIQEYPPLKLYECEQVQ